MSQLTRTVLGSCGLIVGWNIAPPPPGPMILKSPGRESPPAASNRTVRATRRRKKIIYFLSLLSLPLFRFLFGRDFLLCQSTLGWGVSIPLTTAPVPKEFDLDISRRTFWPYAAGVLAPQSAHPDLRAAAASNASLARLAAQLWKSSVFCL